MTPEAIAILEKEYDVQIDTVPDDGDIEDWMSGGDVEALDGCVVEVDGVCPHGCPSWLIVLGWV